MKEKKTTMDLLGVGGLGRGGDVVYITLCISYMLWMAINH
jgi:hypothetical protein